MAIPVLLPRLDPLAKYRRCTLVVACIDCAHKRRMTAEALLRLVGECEVGEARSRMRCSKCGGRKPEIFRL
jgi:hypothetical protein